MEYLIILLCILIIVYHTRHDIEKWSNRRYVTSNIDNKAYGVLTFYNIKGGTLQDAADKLAEINQFLLNVIKYMNDKYIINGHIDEEYKTNPKMIEDRRKFVMRLRNYDPDSLFENSPSDDSDTSYVLNKGDSMNLCLRESKSGEDRIHQMNLLQYVALHELTHIGSAKYGHGLLFWKDFKYIIKNAKEAGLYEPINYKKYPDEYCSIDVVYNPYFDDKL